MANQASEETTIEIIDQKEAVVATITTDRPQWSFDQYSRNRETAGWRWRYATSASMR